MKSWARIHARADKACQGSSHDIHWTWFDAITHVGQCQRCRQNIAINHHPRVVVAMGLDALCGTDGRPSSDWPGCID